MDCCAVERGLNSVFNQDTARDDARRFLKQGLEKPARKLAAAIAERGIAGASLLEIGGGVGGLHLTLLQRGVATATSVEIASAYLAEAQPLAAKLHLQDRVAYHHADFAREAASIPPADIVLLHRVVCCYPDMQGLLTAAASHARRVLAFSFPTDAWYIRLGGALLAAWMRLTRSEYHFYLHSAEAMTRTVTAAGFRLVHRTSSFPWQIVVWERG